MARVDVELAGSSYAIHIGPALLDKIGSLMRDAGLGGRAAVVTHPEISTDYACAVQSSLEQAGFQAETALIPQGEASKSLKYLEILYERFAAMRLDRGSSVVALGGGVIGDLAGFAAATYLRGIALVQAPTTLLAQVDASVGGKTAIDLACGKNLVGAFHQPRLVVADIDTLKTLPPRELCSGLAEVVKYGVISDPSLFALLEENAPRLNASEPELLTRIVLRSCDIKAEVVRQDPEERGLRAILNYGHTVGHALEAVLGYGTITHGEAVAVGMSAAARLAVRLELLDETAATRQDALLDRLGLPTLPFELPTAHSFPATAPGRTQANVTSVVAALLEAMALDKKTSGGRLRFVLPLAIGRVELREVAAEPVEAVLREGLRC